METYQGTSICRHIYEQDLRPENREPHAKSPFPT